MQVNEEEDRRRLKEKLKEALESAARNALLQEEPEHKVCDVQRRWVKYKSRIPIIGP